MRIFGALGLATCGAIAVTSNVALANTYSIDEANNGVGAACSLASPCGTVTVTDNGPSGTPGLDTYTFTIDLTFPGLQLHTNNGGGTPLTIAFDLAGVTSIVSGPVTNLTQPSGNQDGFGSFDAGVSCNVPASGTLCSPTGASGNDLVFTVLAPGGEVLTPNGSGNFLSLDAALPGGTGFLASNADAPVPGPVAGAGMPGLMFGSLGLMWFARRRQQRWWPV